MKLKVKLTNLSTGGQLIAIINKVNANLLNIKPLNRINIKEGIHQATAIVEIDIESLDKAHIRYILTQIREEFKDLIENFNIMEFYQVHKKSYLPQYLFNTE